VLVSKPKYEQDLRDERGSGHGLEREFEPKNHEEMK